MTASRAASLWLTVERKTITGKGKKRRASYKPRVAKTVSVKAGSTSKLSLSALPKGEYRVTFRLGGRSGAVQRQQTITLR